MPGDPFCLTGKWTGVFSYPRGLPPNPFEAELREFGESLTGETFEILVSQRRGSRPMHASIDGSRINRAVEFVKRYDDLARSATPVHYSGMLNGTGDEISGTWQIAGHWSGTFLMIRAAGKTAKEERKVAATTE